MSAMKSSNVTHTGEMIPTQHKRDEKQRAKAKLDVSSVDIGSPSTMMKSSDTFLTIQWKTSTGQHEERKRLLEADTLGKMALPLLAKNQVRGRTVLQYTCNETNSPLRPKERIHSHKLNNVQLWWCCRKCRKKLPRSGHFVSICSDCAQPSSSTVRSNSQAFTQSKVHYLHQKPTPPGPCLFGNPIGQTSPRSVSYRSHIQQSCGYFNPKDALQRLREYSEAQITSTSPTGSSFKKMEFIGTHIRAPRNFKPKTIHNMPLKLNQRVEVKPGLCKTLGTETSEARGKAGKRRKSTCLAPSNKLAPEMLSIGKFVFSCANDRIYYKIIPSQTRKNSRIEIEDIKKRGLSYRRTHEKKVDMKNVDAQLSAMLNSLSSKQRDSIRLETVHQRRSNSNS